MNKKPELLAPAGSPEALDAALAGGADAVYIGGTLFNARMNAKNFERPALLQAVEKCHRSGAKLYVTLNTLVLDRQMKDALDFAAFLYGAGVDALIVADLGLSLEIHRRLPDFPLHASTQMSGHNAEAARFLHTLGFERMVCARELSGENIRQLVQNSPIEIEAFVHGALCVCHSGQCLFSSIVGGRSGNRGECAQPCRYQYALMEEKRPGEYFPVFEDEKGTYIMNSRDMCMIDHLDDLMAAGVDCLKIEGRAKSAYYAAIVTGAYRHCLDDVAAGRPLDPVWRDEVEHISHRHYATGFFYGQPGQYYESARYLRDWQICAVVTNCDENGLATLSLRNKFAAGDIVEVVGPDTKPFTITVPVMRDSEGNGLAEPKTPQMVFTMQLPRPVPPMSFIRHAVALSGK